jgi:hypothetical protein
LTLATLGQLRLSLSNPDFTTAKRIAIAVNEDIGALRWSERAASCQARDKRRATPSPLLFQRLNAGGCCPRRDVPACRQPSACGGGQQAHRPRAL